MKKQKIVMTIAVGVFSLLSYELHAQQQVASGKDSVAYIDSVKTASQEAIQTQRTKDANTIAEYQYDRKETRAKAKEARRIENEANAAARESRYALRAEKRAQKARKDADKQADKASRARVTSDRN